MTRRGDTNPRADHEVVVLGGGAAGCAAAMLLARRGHDVALVRPAVPQAGALAVSVPPSAKNVLLELGVLADLEAARFHRNSGNTVWWAGADARVEPFEEGRSGFHVDRAGLETVMGAAASKAGVCVYTGTGRALPSGEGAWVVHCASDHAPTPELRAPWILDATGRRGALARGEGREPDNQTTTVALVRRWRRPGGFDGVDPSHTIVESYEDGWAWSVPLDREVRCLTAMIDPRYTPVAGADVDAALDEELDKAGRVGGLREGAVPVGSAWACPASLYTSARFGRAGLLLVGDAGSFIDPLSSFGVKKALASGWLAAVVVHTALVDASMTDTAVAFFDAREREVYRRYRAGSADLFDACARVYGHAYWQVRADAAQKAGGGSRAESTDVDSLDGGTEVPVAEARAELERIRDRPHLHAVRGTSVRTVLRPTVVGHRIVLDRHLASDRAPDGLRYVRNVDVRRVVEIAPLHAEVPLGWAAYNSSAPAVTLPDYLAALATAFVAGLLEHRDAPPL
ncbi:MAG: tryptophan 7-halogenase [Gemmatimonadota bacterium]